MVNKKTNTNIKRRQDRANNNHDNHMNAKKKVCNNAHTHIYVHMSRLYILYDILSHNNPDERNGFKLSLFFLFAFISRYSKRTSNAHILQKYKQIMYKHL